MPTAATTSPLYFLSDLQDLKVKGEGLKMDENVRRALTALITASGIGLGAYSVKSQLDQAKSYGKKWKHRPLTPAEELSVLKTAAQEKFVPSPNGVGFFESIWRSLKDTTGDRSPWLSNSALATATIGIPASLIGFYKFKKLIDQQNQKLNPRKQQLEAVEKDFNSLLRQELQSKTASDVRHLRIVEGFLQTMEDQAEHLVKDAGIKELLKWLAIPATAGLGYLTYERMKSLDPDRIKTRAAEDAYKRYRRLYRPTPRVVLLTDQDDTGKVDELDTNQVNMIPLVVPKRHKRISSTSRTVRRSKDDPFEKMSSAGGWQQDLYEQLQKQASACGLTLWEACDGWNALPALDRLVIVCQSGQEKRAAAPTVTPRQLVQMGDADPAVRTMMLDAAQAAGKMDWMGIAARAAGQDEGVWEAGKHKLLAPDAAPAIIQAFNTAFEGLPAAQQAEYAKKISLLPPPVQGPSRPIQQPEPVKATVGSTLQHLATGPLESVGVNPDKIPWNNPGNLPGLLDTPDHLKAALKYTRENAEYEADQAALQDQAKPPASNPVMDFARGLSPGQWMGAGASALPLLFGEGAGWKGMGLLGILASLFGPQILQRLGGWEGLSRQLGFGGNTPASQNTPPVVDPKIMPRTGYPAPTQASVNNTPATPPTPNEMVQRGLENSGVPATPAPNPAVAPNPATATNPTASPAPALPRTPASPATPNPPTSPLAQGAPRQPWPNPASMARRGMARAGVPLQPRTNMPFPLTNPFNKNPITPIAINSPTTVGSPRAVSAVRG